MDTLTRHVESFRTKDKSGKTYTIHCYQVYLVSQDLDGNVSYDAGLKHYQTGDHGGGVNFIDDDTFKIVATDTLVTRV